MIELNHLMNKITDKDVRFVIDADIRNELCNYKAELEVIMDLLNNNRVDSSKFLIGNMINRINKIIEVE